MTEKEPQHVSLKERALRIGTAFLAVTGISLLAAHQDNAAREKANEHTSSPGTTAWLPGRHVDLPAGPHIAPGDIAGSAPTTSEAPTTTEEPSTTSTTAEHGEVGTAVGPVLVTAPEGPIHRVVPGNGRADNPNPLPPAPTSTLPPVK